MSILKRPLAQRASGPWGVRNLKRIKGFTLVELLVVIGILGILLAIVLVALNPARQFSQANNTARRNDVNALLNAIHQFAADNRGTLPAGIPVDPDPAASISDTGVDICADISPTYIALLPTDPGLETDPIADCTVAYDTGYTVVQDASGRVTVAAPSAELSESISFTR